MLYTIKMKIEQDLQNGLNKTEIIKSRFHLRAWLLWVFIMILGGCAGSVPRLHLAGTDMSFQEGTIISTQKRSPVTFSEMISDLRTVSVIYIGETHTDPLHHDIQLRIIRALFRETPDLAVGMEMFDQSYQPVLIQWSKGILDKDTFLRKVHWYANWRYNFDLYASIMEFIQSNRLPLFGLNIPFHIPPRIAVGGLENLSHADREFIPEKIDTTNSAHRAYLEKIFKHHRLKGRDRFDDFYMTQCVWEETMAETIARHLKKGKMDRWLEEITS